MSRAAVVLAAGQGARFGGRKLLATLDGRPLLAHVIGTAVRADLDPVVVVTGAAAEDLRAAADPGPGTPVVWHHNPRYREGQSTSLRAGLLALTGDTRTEVAVILLGDEPGVPAVAVRRVAAAGQRCQRATTGIDAAAPAVRTRYLDGAGHPVAFPRRSWERVLTTSRGDRGARDLLAAGSALEVEVAHPRPRDVDHPDDLAALGRHLAQEQ